MHRSKAAIKEWRAKQVKGHIQSMSEEYQDMQDGVNELKEAISSIDKQIDEIQAGKGYSIKKCGVGEDPLP